MSFQKNAVLFLSIAFTLNFCITFAGENKDTFMDIEQINYQGKEIAVVTDTKKIITDVQSALDLVMSVKYNTSTSKIAIDKALISDDFFVLSTGIAGEILQKFINYNVQVAIFGDFSVYTSKPLRDFIYESNKGRHFFFVATKQEALECLCKN